MSSGRVMQLIPYFAIVFLHYVWRRSMEWPVAHLEISDRHWQEQGAWKEIDVAEPVTACIDW